ncbi:Hsp33 family molecular chaperone HslO [Herbivorax sp. ANBcel31]|uniref:Hsp33 family molecular chaperone HslO n=1 Tax=Herbivorax sp. ANBcel31 TaxID=3069754 RepID=UPI0027B84008|nr:Hsp33 family molecular chaperone HslO [Herbivorax sp. ANBcel31]MDQ2085397.1 Hsp33 family molecular chaperone HslO [Herbivorax sp. ANBcel31]
MKDYIVRATAEEGKIRVVAAVTTDTVKHAQKVHNLSPLASVAMGRTLTASALMSVFLKGDKDTQTIQIKGDGPLGGIVAVSDSKANVRGYVHNPLIYLPLNDQGKFDVAGAVGKGYLNVVKDMGLKEPYVGYVDLVSGEIGEDVAYYYAYSEQIPTSVALGVLASSEKIIESAGGFIIQLMPDAGEETISFIEERINKLPSVTGLLKEGKTPEDILDIIFSEKGLKVVEKAPCNYKCNCSRQRMYKNIISLGKEEIIDILKKQQGIETQCHFCNMKYQFSDSELKEIIESKN